MKPSGSYLECSGAPLTYTEFEQAEETQRGSPHLHLLSHALYKLKRGQSGPFWVDVFMAAA